MPFALRFSSLHRLLRPLHTRFLTTFPKPTPTYYKTWDPTKHSSLPPPEPATKPEGDTETALVNDARQRERRELRDAQSVKIVFHTQDVEIRYAIKRLNRRLQSGTKGGSQGEERLPYKLWRAYTLAKHRIPALPSLMSDRAWDVIWDIRAKYTTDSKRKAQEQLHLGMIHRDMDSVGKKATVGQRIAYLESVFFKGEEQQALRDWEEDHNRASGPLRHDYKPEHLELGVKLHALAGHPDRAKVIMEKLFDLYPAWDRSVMISVIRAHTEVKSATYHDTARALYTDLKEKLGDDMTMAQYDACFVGFLQARHLRHAKQVFRDMVKNGGLASSFAYEEVEEVLKRLHMLYRLGTDIEKMTGIALQVLSILPQPYHSHVFSDWMTSAVARQAPDAAAQILDMMFSRGYLPDTFHFNLLLKALFHTKDEPRVLKAENIGWRMIEEARKASYKKDPGVPAPKAISKRASLIAETVLDSEAARKVPKANITTFALIMQHHGTSQQWEHVDYLARQLRATDIQPNAEYMNVVMDNYCRKGKYVEAWKTYKSLTDAPEGTPGVFPDGASIRCLWKTLRLALGDNGAQNQSELPTPRELLAETVLWWTRCRSRGDVERFRIGVAAANNMALTSLMMHCFSYTADFAGSLVALHVARTFSIFPNDQSAQILQNQAAWVDMRRETDSVRSQYHHGKSHKNSLEKLSRVYYILMDRRLERVGLTEDNFDRMTKEELGDFGLNLLSEFIRVIMKRSHPPEAVEAMIKDAKQEVGVSDLSTGDMDAFAVA